MKKTSHPESGIAHIGFIIVVAAVVTFGGFAYWRVSNSNKTQYHGSDTSEVQESQLLPESIDQIKSLDEIQQIASSGTATDIISFVLETDDGVLIYKVKTSDGRELKIDASTGAVISESTFEVGDDEKLPAGVSIALSPSEAYKLAIAQYNKRVKKIELEIEDTKAVYKIEFSDGSKIELNASNGAVVKSQIRDRDDDDDDDNDDAREGSSDREDEEDDDDERSSGRDNEDDDEDDENETDDDDDDEEDDR